MKRYQESKSWTRVIEGRLRNHVCDLLKRYRVRAGTENFTSAGVLVLPNILFCGTAVAKLAIRSRLLALAISWKLRPEVWQLHCSRELVCLKTPLEVTRDTSSPSSRPCGQVSTLQGYAPGQVEQA